VTTWIYFFGTDDGKFVKIGKTSSALAQRRAQLMQGQFSRVELFLLAAVRTARPSIEKQLHNYFAGLAADVNSTETFLAAPELIEYINWLRQQWWTTLDYDDTPDDIPDTPEWFPADDRRVPLESSDPAVLLQVYDVHGSLAGTIWSALSTPTPIGNDYYTPKHLVDAAREAMDGIDLDPASHWMANRVHKIPKYYHLGRRAEDNPWEGRVWLNPPYGNNAPWFAQILQHWDSGQVTQLCMLSPVWVFSAAQARSVIDRSSAMMLLSPTPTFWGEPHGKTGTNHPHAILYMGSRPEEFKAAFGPYGIPMRLG
jgi:hypothetical protein